MRISILLLTLLSLVTHGQAQDVEFDSSRGDELASEYFRLETEKLTRRTFADVDSLEAWQGQREKYRRQLLEMLGLDPLPERTDLKATITGEASGDGFVVENLHFQSRPGLYVTANLYRPTEQDGPLPAVLYVCGHGRVKKDGISYGNKTHYQHHGAWFARNGYVCLTIDTIQLGELEGIHHGTYREKMWWWNNRGYTPAGVEAWNCVRSLDYLQSRKEVDGQRMGVTGRSGGGAYSWWIAAIDDRIKAAVPVAGITSLHNHVVDGCVEGHCDCMYMVNTFRWDYPMVAALVAPRPLLISNTDKDRIFPLDGVVDVHANVRKIYELYDAGDKLGLQITEGPHKDTQELRVHAFRWFNRFLKQDEELIEKTAIKYFEPEQLKVFDTLPADERVTDIHESFVAAVSRNDVPQTRQELLHSLGDWTQSLRRKTFGGWPGLPEGLDSLDVEVTAEQVHDGVRVRRIEYTSQKPYRLAMYVLQLAKPLDEAELPNVVLSVLDQERWEQTAAALVNALPDGFDGVEADGQRWQEIRQSLTSDPKRTLVFCAPRGVGPTEWSRDERKRTQVRRRFMQLGQTAAGMQIWDVRRALMALTRVDAIGAHPLQIHATGEAGIWALYASLYQPRVHELVLEDLPTSNRDAPDLLNVSRFLELTHLLMWVTHRNDEIKIRLIGDGQLAEQWQPVMVVNSKAWSPSKMHRRERIILQSREK